MLDGVRDLGHQRGQQQVGDGHRGERGDRLERGRLDAVAHVGQLHHADRVGERRVLEQRHEIAHQRRQRDLEGLGEHHVEEDMRARQPQGACRLGLPARHGQQACADGFGVVGAHVQAQRHHGGGEVGQVEPRHQHRQREIHEQDLHQQRRAADHPDVEAGHPAQRRPARGAGQGRAGAENEAAEPAHEREPERGARAVGEGLRVGADGVGEEGEGLAEQGQGQHHQHQGRDQRRIAALLAAPVPGPKSGEHGESVRKAGRTAPASGRRTAARGRDQGMQRTSSLKYFLETAA